MITDPISTKVLSNENAAGICRVTGWSLFEGPTMEAERKAGYAARYLKTGLRRFHQAQSEILKWMYGDVATGVTLHGEDAA